MKKILAVAAVFLTICLGFLTAGLCIRGREYARFPDGGIYFAEADSYYSYSDKTQNPLITLTCFEVNKGNGRSLLSYEDMYLSDKAGNRYAVKDASISYIFSDYYMSRATVQIVLDAMEFEYGEVYTLEKIHLTEDDSSTAFAIGKVRIAMFENSDNEAQIAFSGYTLGAKQFASYIVAMSNNGGKDVYFKELILSIGCPYTIKVYDTNGTVYGFEEYVLRAGEMVYVRVEFETEGEEKEFPFNYLKPSLKFRSGEKEYVLAVGGVSDYVGSMDREDIQNYLQGRANG